MPLTTQLASTTEGWQHQLRNVITSRNDLLQALGLTLDEVGLASGACEDFALKVPRSFVRRMRHGDPRDPLLLQVLSRQQEMSDVPGYVRDPVDENGCFQAPVNDFLGVHVKEADKALMALIKKAGRMVDQTTRHGVRSKVEEDKKASFAEKFITAPVVCG